MVAGQVQSKFQKFAFVLLASVTGLVLATARLQSEPLLEVWRGAFAPDVSSQDKPPPATQHQISLGADLFRDPRLSGDVTRACITCHNPDMAFTDGLPRAVARAGSTVTLRNTPTLYGVGSARVLNWDGSATTLEQQALGPIQKSGELAGKFPEIISRLNSDKEMVKAFEKAFPKTPRIEKETIVKALSRYVASLHAPNTKFDAWVAGDDTAFNDVQRMGLQLFVGKGGCVACHSGPRLTDEAFHDIGLPDEQVFADQDVAGKRGVRAFKTPTLRAISKTAPFMHNGSLKTLSDVVNHYTDGIVRRRGLSGVLPPRLELSAKEKAALVVFLETL